MLFISAHEQLRQRYGTWTLPPRSLKKKEKKKNLSFKASSTFLRVVFLAGEVYFMSFEGDH